MTKNIYLPIVTNNTKQIFFDYVQSLDIPQIDYFAIGVQNQITKKSISLMSLPEWQQHFIKNEYASYDPLRRVTLHTKRNFIPFQEVDCIDNFGKEIMKQRALMGIINGVILMQRFRKYNYMITLGTGFSRFNAFDFLERYHDKIDWIKKDLIQLIEKDARNFLSEICLEPTTHLSNDAK